MSIKRIDVALGQKLLFLFSFDFGGQNEQNSFVSHGFLKIVNCFLLGTKNLYYLLITAGAF